jgi:hypothetical protein
MALFLIVFHPKQLKLKNANLMITYLNEPVAGISQAVTGYYRT